MGNHQPQHQHPPLAVSLANLYAAYCTFYENVNFSVQEWEISVPIFCVPRSLVSLKNLDSCMTVFLKDMNAGTGTLKVAPETKLVS